MQFASFLLSTIINILLFYKFLYNKHEVDIMEKDWESANKMQEFFAERGIQKVIQK